MGPMFVRPQLELVLMANAIFTRVFGGSETCGITGCALIDYLEDLSCAPRTIFLERTALGSHPRSSAEYHVSGYFGNFWLCALRLVTLRWYCTPGILLPRAPWYSCISR